MQQVSEYFDKETGTIYLRARYYNPGYGRFITRDSYTGEENNPLSLNLYTYCGNDPVNNVDPSGHIYITYHPISKGYPIERVSVSKTKNSKRYYVDKMAFDELVKKDGYPLKIDTKWEKSRIKKMVKNAVPKSVTKKNWFSRVAYAATESPTKGKMDQKQNLKKGTIYIFKGEGYTYSGAGNIIWGAAMRRLHFSYVTTYTSAQAYQILSYGKSDSAEDIKAFTAWYFWWDKKLSKKIPVPVPQPGPSPAPAPTPRL